MYNFAKKDELLEGFHQLVKESYEENCGNYNLEEAMLNSDVDRVRTVVRAIQQNAISCIPVGLPVPKASLYVSASGEGEISLINITISNKITSNKNFHYSYVATRGKTAEKVNEFIVSIYESLLVDDLVSSNLEKVNEVLREAAAMAGIGYSVKVVSGLGNGGKKIASITDDSIEFVADGIKAFHLDDILVLHEPDELISAEKIAEAKQQIADELATAQTPEELVGIRGGMLISYIADINKRVKPITLIRSVVNRDASKLHGQKDEIGYFSRDKVYAIVARRNGHFEVVLSPFDMDTLRKVDFDVVKALA